MMKESVCDQRGHLQIGQVPGYPKYRVLSSGSVWHKLRNRWAKLSVYPDKYDYLKMNLSVDGKKKQFYLHTVVLLTFVGPCPARNQCRHLDGDKLNNHLENLCWGTAKENAADTRRHGTSCHGTSPLGSHQPQAKLTESDVLTIRRRVHFGKYGIQRQLSLEYGVCDATISHIVSRHKWAHLPEELY